MKHTFLVLAFAVSMAPPVAAQPPSPQSVQFRVKVSDTSYPEHHKKQGKGPADEVELVLPGTYALPGTPLPAVAKTEARRDSPLATVASDEAANKTEDLEWILSNFTPGTRKEVEELLAGPDVLKRNRELCSQRQNVRVVGQVELQGHVLVLLKVDGVKPPGEAVVLKKEGDRWLRTNAMANDPTYDVVFCAITGSGSIAATSSGR